MVVTWRAGLFLVRGSSPSDGRLIFAEGDRATQQCCVGEVAASGRNPFVRQNGKGRLPDAGFGEGLHASCIVIVIVGLQTKANVGSHRS